MPTNRLPAIVINDSTLRDAQLSPLDQIDVAVALEQAGVDEIELSLVSPGHSAIDDMASVAAALSIGQPIVWGPATRGTVDAAVRAGFDAVYLSVPLSAGHPDRRGLLAAIRRVVGYAADRGLFVALSGEDASRSDLDLVCNVIEAAEGSGARRFRYTDTTGVLHPIRTHRLFRQLCAETDLELEFRGHDHFGLATTNTMAAMQGGATHVSVSMAGTNEAGPVGLSSFAEALRLSAEYHARIDDARLPALVALVTARTGRPFTLNQSAPTTGMPRLVGLEPRPLNDFRPRGAVLPDRASTIATRITA